MLLSRPLKLLLLLLIFVTADFGTLWELLHAPFPSSELSAFAR